GGRVRKHHEVVEWPRRSIQVGLVGVTLRPTPLPFCLERPRIVAWDVSHTCPILNRHGMAIKAQQLRQSFLISGRGAAALLVLLVSWLASTRVGHVRCTQWDAR